MKAAVKAITGGKGELGVRIVNSCDFCAKVSP
jgi:hypothetical protein